MRSSCYHIWQMVLLGLLVTGGSAAQPPGPSGDPAYAGSASCAGCHSDEYAAWQGSHHDRAMQHASDSTVLGDFSDSTFSHYAGNYRFYRTGDQFTVSFTPASGGDSEQFQVLYTFGVEPLQQYLIPQPGGRLQALPIAWDTLQQRWYDVQGELHPQPNERIHWRNGGLNWNSMCADCHSTGLEKNYQPGSDSYATQWAEINVGCESCHGPAAAHANWPADGVGQRPLPNGQPALANDQAASCGQCHARRGPLLGGGSAPDYAIEGIAAPLYHPDGQINDEVFVLGSYLQSKMHSVGITCSSCHEPHSNQLRQPGNALCASCHEPHYNSPAHHRHASYTLPSDVKPTPYTGAVGNRQLLPEQSLGNQCVDCHMPGKYYMGNDFRRDHRFSVPRPDLAAAYPQLNLPNACGDCHSDREPSWAAAQIVEWFGPERAHHHSEPLLAATTGNNSPLYELISSGNAAPIARATAMQTAPPTTLGGELEPLLRAQLTSPSPLLRRAAVLALSHFERDYRRRVLAALADDPAATVRLAVAQALSDIDSQQLPAQWRTAFAAATRDYQDYLTANSDFPSLRYQAAVNHHRRGELDQAVDNYRAALALDNRFNPARYNLAQLYYQRGQRQQARTLYAKIVEQEPNAAAARHALGLLLGELGDNAAAIEQLARAAALSDSPRSWYNVAILQQRSGAIAAAEASYRNALAATPDNLDYLTGLVSLLVQNQRHSEARSELDAAIKRNPYHRQLRELRHSLQ